MSSVLKIIYSRNERYGANSPIKEESVLSIDNPDNPDECIGLFEIMLRNMFDDSSISITCERPLCHSEYDEAECDDEDGLAPIPENTNKPATCTLGVDWGVQPDETIALALHHAQEPPSFFNTDLRRDCLQCRFLDGVSCDEHEINSNKACTCAMFQLWT